MESQKVEHILQQIIHDSCIIGEYVHVFVEDEDIKQWLERYLSAIEGVMFRDSRAYLNNWGKIVISIIPHDPAHKFWFSYDTEYTITLDDFSKYIASQKVQDIQGTHDKNDNELLEFLNTFRVKRSD